ncbi:MAG: hypothetical protein OEZ01_16300 [Candidatus Heimdallarchaeota archaeon]|nr:hypothetical protein [Candidatus Heimdallarchaeota archaeon]MDH5647573.1 hypothetical protein [Candidatus Heimdallarchaeota archaeon]
MININNRSRKEQRELERVNQLINCARTNNFTIDTEIIAFYWRIPASRVHREISYLTKKYKISINRMQKQYYKYYFIPENQSNQPPITPFEPTRPDPRTPQNTNQVIKFCPSCGNSLNNSLWCSYCEKDAAAYK